MSRKPTSRRTVFATAQGVLRRSPRKSPDSATIERSGKWGQREKCRLQSLALDEAGNLVAFGYQQTPVAMGRTGSSSAPSGNRPSRFR